MVQKTIVDDAYFVKTRSAVIWTSILSEPLWTAYSFLVIILYKDLNATLLQISIFTTLKPVVGILSMYWSFSIRNRRDKLRSNVVWAGILGRLPFFLFPFVNGPWVVIIGGAFYMMLKRGELPAWMEILKLNMPKKRREKVFSLSSAFAYAEGIIITIGMGMLLDKNVQAWRFLFPLSALIGIGAVLIQSKLKVNGITESIPQQDSCRESIKERFVAPWKQAFKLVKERSDFRSFQWGFMLGGFALMIIMPALPIFFVDILGISYTDLAIAVGICKAAGFVISSQVWARMLNKTGIFRITGLINVMFGMFFVCLIMSQHNMVWFYIAYFLYGVAQGGSHLSWSLSGPIFSRDEDSSMYSSVNVLMVGVRGCVGPPLGAVMCLLLGPMPLLFFAATISYCVGIKMWRRSKSVVFAE